MPTSPSSTWRPSPIARPSKRRCPPPPLSTTSLSTPAPCGATPNRRASALVAPCAASRCRRRPADPSARRSTTQEENLGRGKTLTRLAALGTLSLGAGKGLPRCFQLSAPLPHRGRGETKPEGLGG